MAKGKSNQAGGASDQTRSILAYALGHLEAERDGIQAKIDHILNQLGTRPAAAEAAAVAAPSAAVEVAPVATGKKRVLSVSARKRIAQAQKKRWAAHRKAKAKA